MPPLYLPLAAIPLTLVAPWLLLVATFAIGVRSLYRRRGEWERYRGVRRVVRPAVLAISSDDWGGMSPEETPEQVEALAGALRSVRDGRGHSAVLTAYLNPAAPDHDAIQAAGYERYAWRFCYQDRPGLVDAWRRVIETDAIDLQFHGREHCNIPLWLELLQGDVPGIREASVRGEIPYLDDKAWVDAVRDDPRLKLLFRSFVDASQSPPGVLPIETQREMIRTGIDLMKEHFGVTPAVFTAPGYVFDSNTCAALAGSPIRYIDTIPGPRRVVDERDQIHETDAIGWDTDLNGLRPIVRSVWFEPTWPGAFRSAESTPAVRIAEKIEMACRQFRRVWACGDPAVLTSHKHNYIGPDQNAAEAGRRALVELLQRVRRERPDVRFVSTGELGRVIHHPDVTPKTGVVVTRCGLTAAGRAANTVRALWVCHPKFRYWAYATAASFALAIVCTAVRV